MQRCSSKEREQFVSLIAQHSGPSPDNMHVFAFARRLLYYGATYGRLQENQCNGPEYPDYAWRLSEDERNKVFNRVTADHNARLQREEKKSERLEKKVKELCRQFGCVPIMGGDPRGCTIKIKVPDGYTNDWGREGICVPTS